jgi:D-alanyl-lipoteichoic acid acyltransferase DltB (MBOAT superfamily)
MVFNSLEFAVFLPIVLLIYWRLGHKSQNRMLLAASYLFYGWWDYRFLSLLLVSTSIDYFVGLRLERMEDEKRRRFLLLISVAANLGILGFFKYFNFFVDSAAEVMRTLGLSPDTPTLRIILPVGISFYTFQSMSYGFDVYRRRIPATRNWFDFALYVAYFPQLVAGPIERAQNLMPQIVRPRVRPDGKQVASGLVLILLGLFKKVAIADVMAPIADAAFNAPSGSSSVTLLVGLYAFALQIYGDFSGYTDIGRGASRLMGIELMENFNQPYLSRNITSFWRTWHISLSNWLHDYLYIPLGGNRNGRFNTYRNLMIVMLLGGLWHGAAWTFVIWGGLHGIYLSVHRAFGKDAPRGYQGRFNLRRDLLPVFITFHLVAFAWVFFRAESVTGAVGYLDGLFSLQPGFTNRDHLVLFGGAALCVVFLDIAQRNAAQHEVTLQWRPVWQGIAYGSLLLALIVFSGGALTPFIYFQF